MSIDIGKRIIILGCCGSGKSVFAKKLNEKTGMPLYHLDNIYWNDDRNLSPLFFITQRVVLTDHFYYLSI